MGGLDDHSEGQSSDSASLELLRRGDVLDYDLRTWIVTEHTAYDETGIETWTLESGDNIRHLEYEEHDDVFRLLESGDITAVTIYGDPFLDVVSKDAPPDVVAYEGCEYPRIETDVRVSESSTPPFARSTNQKVLGVCAGLSELLYVPPFLGRLASLVACIVLSFMVGGDYGTYAGLMVPLGGILLYGGLYFVMEAPDARRTERTSYWVYAADGRVVALECWGSSDWTVYVGEKVERYEFDNILPVQEAERTVPGVEDADVGLGSSTGALTQLSEGDVLDYDMQTWTVAEHTGYADETLPDDVWRLENNGDALFLEHEADDERDRFRLFTPASLSWFMAEDKPLEQRIGHRAPATIDYNGDEYTIAEKDARIEEREEEKFLTRSREDRWIAGVIGGIAEYAESSEDWGCWVSLLALVLLPLVLNGAIIYGIVRLFGGRRATAYRVLFIILNAVPPAFILGFLLYVVLYSLIPLEAPSEETGLNHFWVYERDDQFVALRCEGATDCRASSDWEAYVGERVAPYEFDNILPAANTGGNP